MEIDFYIEVMTDLIEIAGMENGETFDEGVKPPEWMKAAVRRGKKIRDKQPSSKQCCTRTGLARANQIENGDNLSLKTIKRMKSFSARHGGQSDFNDPESKQAQSLLLWGVPYTKKGHERFMKWCDTQIKKLEKN